MQNQIKGDALEEHDVAVYYANTDIASEAVPRFQSLLSSEEKSRACRFRYSKDKNRYIVRYGILRFLLSSYLGCRPDQVEIQQNSGGKPFLQMSGASGLYFNISSSNAITVIAIAQHCELGIDIEKVMHIQEMHEIVDRHFTGNEKQRFYSFAGYRRIELFYRFWTRKEAVLKALGTGLFSPLEKVDVSMVCFSGSQSREVIVRGPEMEAVYVADLEGPPGYALALASTERVSHTLIQQISPALIGL